MVTGASTADVALILIDVRQGVVEQSRRHAFISALLGIRHLVVCVNKMDLVGFDPAAFEAVRQDFLHFARRLGEVEITFIPISALQGDNVVDCSPNTPWYTGRTLLDHLETLDVHDAEDFDHPRFPVQYVIRPMSAEHHDYRGYAGSVAGGTFRPGDEVLVLPSGRRTRIEAIDAFDGPVEVAVPPMSVTLRLADDVDVSRGDMIASPATPPKAARAVEAWVCWMSERGQLAAGSRFALKHTTHAARAIVQSVAGRLEINSLKEEPSDGLALNEIGRVRLKTTEPLFVDWYAQNRRTGSFILIDEVTNNTVGAGMIVGATEEDD
jgi:bifunctional enzyme CysN/CysC